MPNKPKKPCSYRGCPELTHDKYCVKHRLKASREYDKFERSPDHNKVYGYRWRKIRGAYLQKNPLCEDCLLTGKLTPADEVHHRIPIAEGGSHAEDNLRSLCQSCHTKTRDT